MPVPYLKCMMLVAALHHFPPQVLPSIQKVEGGRPGLVHPNSNNTQDLGLMQINTRWVWSFARATGKPASVVYARLRDDPCYSIAAAGAILDLYRHETRGDLMRAIGNYHSHTPLLNEAYQMKVLAAAYRLVKPGASAPVMQAAYRGGGRVYMSPYMRRKGRALSRHHALIKQ